MGRNAASLLRAPVAAYGSDATFGQPFVCANERETVTGKAATCVVSFCPALRSAAANITSWRSQR